jgi:hypothetical protein
MFCVISTVFTPNTNFVMGTVSKCQVLTEDNWIEYELGFNIVLEYSQQQLMWVNVSILHICQECLCYSRDHFQHSTVHYFVVSPSSYYFLAKCCVSFIDKQFMISCRFDFVKYNALILLQKKGKLRISSVKRSNLKHTKLRKQGKLKCRRHKKKSELLHKRNKNQQPKSKLPEVEEEQSDHGEELLQMVEKDDLEFLQNAVTSHSYSLLNHIRFTK